MSEQKMTQARGINGKMSVQQDDGSWREVVSETDRQALDALTDEEIEQQAREDGTHDADIDAERMVFYGRDDDREEKPDAAD